MNKVFYDSIIILEEVEKAINQTIESHQEKQEIWQLVDNITHQRIIFRILKVLPETHHNKFLDMFHEAPHDEELLEFLKEKSKTDIETELQKEAEHLTLELLELIHHSFDDQSEGE